MRRLLPLTVILALAACGKSDAPSGGGGGSPPPASADQAGPSDPAPIDPATVGTVTGTVRLQGWLKPDVPVPLLGIPYCAAQHPGGAPPGDTLVLGEGQTMANVFVLVRSGLGKRKFPVNDKPAILDQAGCIYKPHVLGVMTNQPVIVRNSDDTMHNVHFKPKLNPDSNRGQSSKGLEDTFKFAIPEPPFSVQCDVHPWMDAIVHVVSHPFFDVTGKDGVYKITGLPPGEYEIEARHERFKNASQIFKIKIGPKETVTQPITFKGGPKPDPAK
ncbi:MAG TPA: carboxypeptidase regulatory-like domain-containing protein [Planctomycetota bacterium]|jgi:hypothetical protein|nr:carboxypeptidase regulatory-like domain-containing protein [Planctomycetota bacterium]